MNLVLAVASDEVQTPICTPSLPSIILTEAIAPEPSPDIEIEGALQKGNRVSLVGFGSWSVSKRAAREGRNPQTGATIKIKAKNVVKFKAGSDLSSAVN